MASAHDKCQFVVDSVQVILPPLWTLVLYTGHAQRTWASLASHGGDGGGEVEAGRAGSAPLSHWQIHMKTMPAAMFRLLTGQETPLYI